MAEAISEEQIYTAIGDEGFTRLIGAFYRRVRSDDVLSRLYPPDDLAAAERRLREFLIQRFGGPATYSQSRGHPRLRLRHAPFRIDAAARNRWLELMEQAIVEAELPDAVLPALRNYFDETATFLINCAE